MIVEAGMRIPADCILVEGHDITVDEAYYNDGKETIIKKDVAKIEEEQVDKWGDKVKFTPSNPDPFLLSKSLVLSGSGRAVVCAVGKHS